MGGVPFPSQPYNGCAEGTTMQWVTDIGITNWQDFQPDLNSDKLLGCENGPMVKPGWMFGGLSTAAKYRCCKSTTTTTTTTTTTEGRKCYDTCISKGGVLASS